MEWLARKGIGRKKSRGSVAAVNSVMSTLTEDLVVYDTLHEPSQGVFWFCLPGWLGGLSFAIESGRSAGNFCALSVAPVDVLQYAV